MYKDVSAVAVMTNDAGLNNSPPRRDRWKISTTERGISKISIINCDIKWLCHKLVTTNNSPTNPRLPWTKLCAATDNLFNIKEV